MNDEEARALAKRLLTESVSGMEDEIMPQLRRAERYYRGECDYEPMSQVWDESQQKWLYEGSDIVITECRDTVQMVLPDVIRIMMSSEDTVLYKPRSYKDVDAAKQATDYANYVWREDNDGAKQLYDILVDWSKKYCVIRVWFEEEERFETSSFDGISMLAVQILEQDETIVELEYEIDEEQISLQSPGKMPRPPKPSSPGDPQGQVTPQSMLDVPSDYVDTLVQTCRGSYKRRFVEQKIHIQAQAPEDFIVDNDAMNLEEASVVGTRRYMRVSDVVAMGFDVADIRDVCEDGISAADEVRRIRDGEYMTAEYSATSDVSMKWVRITDAKIRMDMDGDGIAELHSVIAAGDQFKILSIEPDPGSDYFIVGSPYGIPHKIIGQGIVENVMDLQDINTTLTRRMIDNLNQACEPRVATTSRSEQTYASLMSKFGGPIPLDADASITWFSTPFVGNYIQPVIDMFGQRKIERTGISPASQGLDPDVLKGQTVEASHAVVTSAQSRVEFLVRRFCDTVMRPMFEAILKIAVAFQDKPTVIRLRDTWVEVDPRAWNSNMDTVATVGLGTGTTQQRIAGYQAMIAKMEQWASMGSVLFDQEKYREICANMFNLILGQEGSQYIPEFSADEYDIIRQQKGVASQQQQAAQLQQQIQLINAQELAKAQAKAQADVAVNQAKIQQQSEADQIKARTSIMTNREDAANEIQIERMKLAAEAEIDAQNRALKLQIAQLQLEMEARLKQLELAAGIGINPNLRNPYVG